MNKCDQRTKGKPAARLAAAAVLLLVAAVPLPGVAQDCDVPLFIQETNVLANVMLLVDNSGSMNEAMYHSDYDPDVVWSGNFDAATTYYVNASGPKTPSNFNGTWPGSPSANLVASDSGQSGRYRGNYLNWIFFHATDEQRAALPQITRIRVAKVVVTDILERSRHVRFGLTRFNDNDGGTIIAQCGADRATLVETVNNIAATTWTPLGETLEDILNYFKRTGDSAPIQAPCQYNFLIVMTDGFPTMDLNVSSYLVDADHDGHDPGNCESIGSPDPNSNNCSDHMDDIAYYMRHTDLRPDMGEPGESAEDGQTVVTYTIGFGIDAYLLDETARNGDGLYFMADNAAELWTSLELILLDIISRISTGAAVAVVSTERGDDDRLYRGKFMPGTWEGYLECFQLPYENGDPSVWEAGYQLESRNPNDRQIFTALGPDMRNFDTGAASDLMGAMQVSDADSAGMIIQWARGNEVAGLRSHDSWPLGDIIHSTPVIVGAPRLFSIDPDYQAFLAYHHDRQKLVYVGANDGMLHAFDAGTGWEQWAFVPEFSLPKLKVLADSSYCHMYSCDQTPAVRDLKVGGTWRTVLVVGGSEGGASYFALDVTEPTAPSVMWQVTLPSGMSYASEVEFAVVRDVPYVMIGSGLDETAGEAYMYVYQVEDGQLAGELLLSNDATARNKATAPRAVDLDLDGETDVVYIGDLQGHLWRFAADSADPDSWGQTLLFACDQPITARPTPAFGEDNRIYVYLGTGAYLTADDIPNTDQQSFYCVYDSHDGGTHTRFDLVDQTTTVEDVGSADGWFVDLWNEPGERVTETAVVAAGNVYFTAYAPSTEACTAGGRSWLYRMQYDDGSAMEDEEEEGEHLPRSQDLDEGVASRPVVDIVNETVIVQSSDATITVEQMGTTFFHLTVRSWQENYEPEDSGSQTELQ